MIHHNQPLKDYNTFGIKCNAKEFVTFTSEAEASHYLSTNRLDLKNTLVLGGGSNVLFTGDYEGTILHPAFNTIEIIARGENGVFVAVDAGVIWDDLVAWAVENDLGGIENLSYIPGSAGAAPVQNIGAYGVEVSAVITKIRALSLSDGTKREFTKAECKFDYRTSLFKTELKGRYMITNLIIELNRKPSGFNLSYGDLESRLAAEGEINLSKIRQAVIAVRKEKLPEPSETGNAGSFFKNPVISSEKARYLLNRYPEMPSWVVAGDFTKIAAAWLIDQAGFKGYRHGNAGVHNRQPLVLVNHGNASGREIIELAEKISGAVSEKFGITLDYEVNII